MFWGFSKSIGGGFRIGVGGRIGGKGGRQKSGPTQSELKKQRNDIFMSKSQEDFDRLVIKWYTSHGHMVLPKDIQKADKHLTDQIKEQVKVLNTTQRLIKDGGSLTEKRKEKVLEAIYHVEELIGQIEDVDSLAKEYELYERSYSTGVNSIFIGLISCLALFFSNWFLILTIGLISFGIFLLIEASALRKNLMITAKVVVSDI